MNYKALTHKIEDGADSQENKFITDNFFAIFFSFDAIKLFINRAHFVQHMINHWVSIRKKQDAHC